MSSPLRYAGRVFATACCLSFLAGSGCSSRQFSTTPRTAIEQMLISGAVDKAMEKVHMPMLDGRKVFVDFSQLKAYDVEYVKVAVRATLARQGAVLVESADAAELTAEVASGALALEYKSGLVGLPSLPVPKADIPLPEMPIYKTIEQTGIMKLLIFVHEGGRFVAADTYYAKVDRDESFFLWWKHHRTDDIRTGWEQADARLEQRKGDADGAGPDGH